MRKLLSIKRPGPRPEWENANVVKVLLGIVAAGLASRLIHTGAPLIDKYLGDALYAAAV
jgi:hypothetical protein